MLDLRGRQIAREAMGLLEAAGRDSGRGIYDVVAIVSGHPGGNLVETGQQAHPEGDRMVGTGAITADSQTADHLPVLVERNATPEGDDSADRLVMTRALLEKIGVEGVGVVESVERAARLGRGIQISGRE